MTTSLVRQYLHSIDDMIGGIDDAVRDMRAGIAKLEDSDGDPEVRSAMHVGLAQLIRASNFLFKLRHNS
jgi:hypothetical protein